MNVLKFSIVLLLALGAGIARAAPYPPLPCADIPIRDLMKSTKGVLVATLRWVGHGSPGPPATTVFHSRWEVQSALRGEYSGEVSLTFSQVTIPPEKMERQPSIGQTYILITYPINDHQIACFIDHSDANVAQARELLSGSK